MSLWLHVGGGVLLFVVFHVEEVLTGVLEGEWRADFGKVHLLLVEGDLREGFALAIGTGDLGGGRVDVLTEDSNVDLDDESNVGDLHVDGGELLDGGELFGGVVHCL